MIGSSHTVNRRTSRRGAAAAGTGQSADNRSWGCRPLSRRCSAPHEHGMNRLSQRKPTALNESSGCISTHSLRHPSYPELRRDPSPMRAFGIALDAAAKLRRAGRRSLSTFRHEPTRPYARPMKSGMRCPPSEGHAAAALHSATRSKATAELNEFGSAFRIPRRSGYRVALIRHRAAWDAV